MGSSFTNDACGCPCLLMIKDYNVFKTKANGCCGL